MKSRFRLKLSIIMIAFAIVISSTFALINYVRLTEQVMKNEQFHIEQIEEMVDYSLRTIEKAYFLFEEETGAKMKSSSEYVVNLYEEQPDFDSWNFQDLKDRLEYDLYIIDEDLRITHSSFSDDIGLDFWACCQKLANILEDRRASGEFYSDGMDIEQHTGEIKKYSYMATPDKKYIIQLGYALQGGPIFEEFNFLHTLEDLVSTYPSINEINVLNMGGFALGEPVEEARLTNERRAAFEQTLVNQELTELASTWQGESAVFRYVPYESNFDLGTTKNKVIEIVYNEDRLRTVMQENGRTFTVQLLIVLLVAIAIAIYLSKWLSKPMYLAFHDSLTGLKNRAAFEESLQTILQEKKAGTRALLMIDLDNFKLVNDMFGHDLGDRLLKRLAEIMRQTATKEDITARLGGDEFVMVMRRETIEDVCGVAQKLLEAISEESDKIGTLEGEKVTASIGISVLRDHGHDLETLYKKADIALYQSKEKGKNQYYVYDVS